MIRLVGKVSTGVLSRLQRDGGGGLLLQVVREGRKDVVRVCGRRTDTLHSNEVGMVTSQRG